MSEEIKIDKKLFHDRLAGLISQWKSDKRNDSSFNGANSIAVCVGKATEGAYPKSAALQVSQYLDPSLRHRISNGK